LIDRLTGLREDARVAEPRVKNLGRPDDTVEFPRLLVEQVDLGDVTVGRLTMEPGWRWYEHVRPRVGGDWCEARHVGFVISGRFGVTMRDGTKLEFGPDDAFEIPPGHDGYALGDEPCVQIEWTGLRAFTGFSLMGMSGRTLVTLLFTDIVDSTATATRLGDKAWRELLSTHYEAARAAVDRHLGHEVNTTGDGLLARFDGPAAALHCASAIRRTAESEAIAIRASVHVGEVEIVGNDVRGIAVHEAARIMSAAGPNEILVSSTTRALAHGSKLEFQPVGVHTLKGLPEEWELFAYVEADQTPEG
jgi:class 3 adenylate cyclase